MIGVALDSPSDSQVPTHGANYVPSMPAFSGNPILLERTRHDAIMMPPCLRYLSTSTECEGGTGPISTNPGSTQACEYGLTHGRYIVARRLEVATVAGLMWISGGVWVRLDFEFFVVVFFEGTRPAASLRSPCLIFLYQIYD